MKPRFTNNTKERNKKERQMKMDQAIANVRKAGVLETLQKRFSKINLASSKDYKIYL